MARSWADRLAKHRGSCKLLLPKPLEPIGRQVGVEHRVLDVAVPQIMLDGAGILTVVGELKPAGMAQKVPDRHLANLDFRPVRNIR
jgi:hypothetical protein